MGSDEAAAGHVPVTFTKCFLLLRPHDPLVITLPLQMKKLRPKGGSPVPQGATWACSDSPAPLWTSSPWGPLDTQGHQDPALGYELLRTAASLTGARPPPPPRPACTRGR